jgi:proteasome lid subunit RPN8/RPN11
MAENVIPARYTRQSPVHLTFTGDSLVFFHTTIEEHYPGRRIVGWYHTHPRMGVFLSQYDTWLHGSFFPEPWQVALVVEPHSSTAGFFIRQVDGSFDPQRYFGFYELNGALGHSLVHWQNLQPAREERESK